MISKIAEATERAERAIDDALTIVEASNRRMSLMEAKRKTG